MSILDELKENIPTRFANMTPYHFEEFIGELFKDSGYQAEITKSTGDFGADVVLTKDNLKTAVQVKRYERGNLVGVKELNQVIGGREYYKCDKAILVTTSDFTKAAKKLARQTHVELWDWERLYSEIKKIYLRGEDIYEFFKDKSGSIDENKVVPKNDNLLFNIDKIEENILMQDKNIATIVYVKMINSTDHKVYVIVEDLPIIIDTLDNQIEAYTRLSGGFFKGYIYPKASVPLMFCWHNDQLPNKKLIKQIIIKHFEGENGTIQETFISPNANNSFTKSFSFEKEYKLKTGKDTQTIKLSCPSCEQEFNYKIIEKNTNEGDRFETKCPYCGVIVSGSVISRKENWRCKYCNKGFDAKTEFEKHERICKNRKK